MALSLEIGSAACPFGTDPQRSISSKPGSFHTATRWIFSLPVFFRLTHVSAGINTSAPGCESYSLSPSQTWALPVSINRISSSLWCLCFGTTAPGEISSVKSRKCFEPLVFGPILRRNSLAGEENPSRGRRVRTSPSSLCSTTGFASPSCERSDRRRRGQRARPQRAA